MAKTDQEPVLGLRGIGWCFQSLTALFIGSLIISAVYLAGERRPGLLEDETTRNNSLLGCNLFSGKWVFDNKSCPLYKERQCSFMLDDFACEKFGRRDLKYQHWRWQPHDCDLPRSLSLSLSLSLSVSYDLLLDILYFC